jgi:hypothetical protein
VLVAERAGTAPPVPVTWVPPGLPGTDASFLVYFGEGASYALIRESGTASEDVAIYHSSDPILVEHLAFQLGHELGVPIRG